jgi:CHAD domain-containing protein
MTQTTDHAFEQCLKQRLIDVVDLLDKLANLKSHKKPQRVNTVDRLSSKPVAPREAPQTQPVKQSKSKLLHDLRTACRRGETALSACDERRSAANPAWIQNRLHEIRELCNPLRDEEVLLKWLRHQPESKPQQKLIKSIRQEIKSEYPLMSERARKAIRQHRFQQQIHKLSVAEDATEQHSQNGHASEPEPNPHAGSQTWRRPLGRWLFHILDGLIREFPDEHDNFQALHQLRVSAKRLRYGMEFVVEIDPKLRLQGSIKALEEMQEKLGELHDAVVRHERLLKEFGSKGDGDELIAAAAGSLQSSLADWKTWWQPHVWKQLLKQSINEVSKLLA